jgi:hypothetical protein
MRVFSLTLNKKDNLCCVSILTLIKRDTLRVYLCPHPEVDRRLVFVFNLTLNKRDTLHRYFWPHSRFPDGLSLNKEKKFD